MLEAMSTVWPLIRLPASYRPYSGQVDVTPLKKEKEQNLHSTIEEIEREEEFFEAKEFFDHDLPSAPNGKSLQVIVRRTANEYINSLVGNNLAISIPTKAKKAVDPEIWTIGQTQKLVNKLNGVHPLLSGNWPFKSKATKEEKDAIIALFNEASDSLKEIESTLKVKITQALANGKSEIDSLGADIFTAEENDKLEELPKLLEEIQDKSKGLYTAGDTLSKRTAIALAVSCASLLSAITGIVLSVLSGQGIIAVALIVAVIPSVVVALGTLASLIATAVFYLEDKKNKVEAENWTQDIEGLTNLSDELKKLKESEMLEAVKQLTSLVMQQNDELIAIKNGQVQQGQKVDMLYSHYGPAVARRGSSDSLNSASSGHDSGVDVRGDAPSTGGMSRSELKESFSKELTELSQDIKHQELKLEQTIQIFSWLTNSTTGKYSLALNSLNIKLLNEQFQLPENERNAIVTRLLANEEKYWDILQQFKKQCVIDGLKKVEDINATINKKIRKTIIADEESRTQKISFA